MTDLNKLPSTLRLLKCSQNKCSAEYQTFLEYAKKNFPLIKQSFQVKINVLTQQLEKNEITQKQYNNKMKTILKNFFKLTLNRKQVNQFVICVIKHCNKSIHNSLKEIKKLLDDTCTIEENKMNGYCNNPKLSKKIDDFINKKIVSMRNYEKFINFVKKMLVHKFL
jgi:hypothetical protein